MKWAFTRNEPDADRTIGRAAEQVNIIPRPADRRAMILALRKQPEPQNQSTTNDEIDERHSIFIGQPTFVNPTVPTPVPPISKRRIHDPRAPADRNLCDIVGLETRQTFEQGLPNSLVKVLPRPASTAGESDDAWKPSVLRQRLCGRRD